MEFLLRNVLRNFAADSDNESGGIGMASVQPQKKTDKNR